MERHRLELGEDLWRELPRCNELWVAVAMASEHGFNNIQHHIGERAKQHWVVGIDLATSPSVLQRFKAGGKKRISGRYFQEPGRTFHPKVYVLRTGDNYVGYVGSGNCTAGGFERNVEIAIRTEEQALCKSLVEQIEAWYAAAYEVDDVFLEHYAKEFERKEQRSREEEKGTLDVYAEVHPYSPLLEALDERSVIWLKPIGTSEDPVRGDQLFDGAIEELNFSKKRPSGVHPGHIVITYGIGQDKILSVFEVISKPEEATVSQKRAEPWRERFPWILFGRNLTPRLGRDWVLMDLRKGALKDDFLQQNPDGIITHAGSDGFGAFMRKADKVRLSDDFGRFMITKIIDTLRNA